MKKFFPDICPECGSPTVIEYGKTKDIIKLKCSNVDCSGSFLKKLQKGIISLDIPGLKEATIEKLVNAGVKTVFDIFDDNIINEDNLIDSGEFKEGRALQKILNSINSVKEISIDKIILSLQLKDIGSTISKESGKMLSGVEYSFFSQNKEATAKLLDSSSDERQLINKYIDILQKKNIKIVYFEKINKIQEINTVTKNVFFDCDLLSQGLVKEDLIKKLKWNETFLQNCNILVINDKNQMDDNITYAKNNNIKVITIQQLKLLFL